MNMEDLKKSIEINPVLEYQSPINIITQDIHYEVVREQEEQILKAILEIGIDVDKDELIKALRYDRDQFEKGFNKGVAAGRVLTCGEWIRIEPYDLNTLQCSKCGYITHERTNYCSTCGSLNSKVE